MILNGVDFEERLIARLHHLLILEATLQDLEQRLLQLEELITSAQNWKNKTSNQEARTIITDQTVWLTGSWYSGGVSGLSL